MITKNEINYKIDWHSEGERPVDAEGNYLSGGVQVIGKHPIIEDRKHYFNMLRRFLLDIKNLGRDEIDEIFAKYNVYFVDVDDIERVNIDEPK
jgi:DNA-directed RNA polymerase alpha subunit